MEYVLKMKYVCKLKGLLNEECIKDVLKMKYVHWRISIGGRKH